jgi:hypothetical protein
MDIQQNSSLDPFAFTSSFLQNAPNYSECAYIGKRRITIAPAMVAAEKGRVLDRNNLELVHEHILFANSGDNIGWGPNGLFSDKSVSSDYQLEDICYSGEEMRRAIVTLQLNERFHHKSLYSLFRNNCQDFISAIRNRIKNMRAASTNNIGTETSR